MNNFYGYLPKNNSKFSNSPSGDDNITGLWNSKKNRQKIEKEAQLLKNRVNLLELEDRKLKKKIDENKQKMMSFIEKRQRNFQDISSKLKKKEYDEQQLSQKRIRNYSSKKFRENFKKNITEEINKLKRSETIEIKKVRETSLNKIKEYRENIANSKKEQYLKIKSTEYLIRKKIKDFWDNKKNQYMSLHRDLKNENDKYSLLKEKEIADLEKKEEELIKKLEKSQNVDERIINQIQEISITPLEDFIQRYGKEQDPNKKHKKSKSLHISLH